MDMIIEFVLDCILSLVVDSGVEVMSDSENSRNWPKGVRIALVAITLLLFTALIGFLIFAGVSFISEGTTAVGVLFLVMAPALIIFSIIKIKKLYKKKVSEK